MNHRRRAAGFTLVEILATLGVLAIGLAAVVALVLGSTKATAFAADRNVATIILSEAIEDIKRNHLITRELVDSLGPVPPDAYDEDIGLYIETIDSTDYPTIHKAPYNLAEVRNKLKLATFKNPFENPYTKTLETMIWPPALKSPRYGGPLTNSSQSANGTGGVPFRVIYSLARHPDWIDAIATATDSPYVGVYVLTLSVNRDLDPELVPGDKNKRYEQVSEPMTVYLKTESKF